MWARKRRMPTCGCCFGKRCTGYIRKEHLEKSGMSRHIAPRRSSRTCFFFFFFFFFERFVTKGNEKADELAEDEALLDGREMAQIRANTVQRDEKRFTRPGSTLPAFTVRYRSARTVKNSSRSRKKGGPCDQKHGS